MKAKTGGQDIDAGVWVEVFEPQLPLGSAYGGGMGGGGPVVVPRMRFDPRLPRGGAPGALGQPDMRRPPSRPGAPTGPTSTDSILRIDLTCRLVNRKPIMVSANEDLAFAVQGGLNASSYFTNATLGAVGLEADSSRTNTFTFTLSVDLKHPFKL